MNKKPIIAFLYDFDKTLCTTDMQDYTFIPSLGYTPGEFWSIANSFGFENRMDGLLAYMYTMIEECRKKGIRLDRDYLVSCGHAIELFPGVQDWFSRINAFGETLGVEILYDEVTGLSRDGEGFAVQCTSGEQRCKAVVLATGAAHRHLGLDGEEALVGCGVSYCAVCDGAFYTGRDVAVVGGGDTALQDALFLANSCRHVTLIHRRDQFRGENRLVRQVEKRENITILYSHTVEALHAANGELTGVTVKDVKTGETKGLTVEGLFAAVGQQPQSAPFAALVNTAGGYYQAGEDTLTDCGGVFAAGDGRVKSVRQLTTAVGDGAVAGLAACRYVDAL